MEKKIAFYHSIGGKILIMVLLIVLAALGFLTAISIERSDTALSSAQYAQLKAIREIKRNQVENYFAERKGDLAVLKETVRKMYSDGINLLMSNHQAKIDRIEAFLGMQSDENIAQVNNEDTLMSFPFEKINQIVQDRSFLGDSGESYLVGEIEGRLSYRSDRVIKDGKIGEEKEGTGILQALEGESGYRIKEGSTGIMEIECFSPVSSDRVNWVLITTVALKDIVAAELPGTDKTFFDLYKDEYGYYDLFLIHPNGRIYYSAEEEADYLTNIINGTYADSGLGFAVRQAKTKQQFAFSDFQPYAPSDGAPASFIVEPLLHEGEIISLVALQMPMDRVNAFMHERTGMGESGESYLVGPDNLMRSDSYLDEEHHSVAASFAAPETGSIETAVVRKALSGESGSELSENYLNSRVYSAYSPINVFDTQWALVTEIGEKEVKQPVMALRSIILLSAAAVLAIAAMAALLFSKTISKPVLLLMEVAGDLAVGDIHLSNVDKHSYERLSLRKDEIGLIGRSFSDLIEYQAEKADIAESIASKDLTVEASVSSDRDSLGIAFKEMIDSLNSLLGQVGSAVEQVNSGADQVSQASQNLSQGATEQASSLEEISSSITEINSQSSQNAENASEAHGIAKQATQDAQQGNQKMKDLKQIMKEINDSSDKINTVVKVIDDIAFQINLLALNANVEAARAGKYGKGFAVVAEEVRNLAVKSAESVQETSSMVEQSVSSIKQGTTASEATAEQLGAIVEGSGRVATFLEEISTASREQAQAIGQITEALDQIDQVTQSNTASAEESASASEELAGQAQQLFGLISEFQLKQRLALEDQR